MSSRLSEYLKHKFPNGKNDLFAAFIYKCQMMAAEHRFVAMITQHGWMFLSSYENLRMDLVKDSRVTNMIHLGARAFDEISGEVVQTTSFVIRNNTISFKTIFNDVTSYNTQDEKKDSFLRKDKQYIVSTEKFKSLALPKTIPPPTMQSLLKTKIVNLKE